MASHLAFRHIPAANQEIAALQQERDHMKERFAEANNEVVQHKDEITGFRAALKEILDKSKSN